MQEEGEERRCGAEGLVDGYGDEGAGWTVSFDFLVCDNGDGKEERP